MKKVSTDFVLNVLIVEDNLSFALDLEMMIQEIGYQVVGRVDSAGEAFEKIYDLEPDLILMDIDLKGKMTGIEVAEKINHTNIPVLFITSWGEESYYERAKQTNQVGYLVKPIEKFTLRSSIEQAFRKLNAKEIHQKTEAFPASDALYFKKKGILHKVQIGDIKYVKADDNYTVIHSEKGNFISALNLAALYEILAAYRFFKTHRSYLVNLGKVDTVDIKTGILSIEGIEIPISRSNRPELMNLLKVVK